MKIIKGDLLNANVDIILHQVNLQGFMGGGIAYQIAKKYPNVENEYMKSPQKELGKVCFVKTTNYVVGNCFSQNWYFETDYLALRQCLDEVIEYMNINNLKTVGIPYNYGCGIACGNWDIVSEIFERKIPDIIIYKL
jgi:O-acetyl-ADP-ribose deacetylase (regulator of RNase III)